MRSRARLDESCRSCLLYAAIEGLEDGLVLVDRRGRVFHLNRSARAILGLGERAFAGGGLSAVLRDPVLVGFWASAVRAPGPATADLRLGPDGVRSVRATVARCFGAAGEPIGRALLLRDVSGERRIQVELATQVARRLVEMSGAPGEDPGTATASLTRRERGVLALLGAGLGNRDIGGRLGISVNTVGSHLKRVYAKIGAGNRAQAATFALAHGVLPAAEGGRGRIRRAHPNG